MTRTTPSILQVCAVDFTARHFLLPLMRAQREAGFDVHLACAVGGDAQVVRDEGFPVHPIPFQRSYNLVAHRRAYKGLVALLRGGDYTVVHTHTPIASVVARLAARRARVPLTFYTAHGFYFHDRMQPLQRRAHIALERFAQRRADFLFTQSEEDLRTALHEGIAPVDCAAAIGNGVDPARFDPAAKSPESLNAARRDLGLADGDGPVVIVIGRLVREKGYMELLRALARLRTTYPRLRVVAIGEALPSDHDASARAIRDLTFELGLDETVIFAGLRDDVPTLLALGDLFCLPSWREGMPRSILEAMAAGLPVVATDIRGCREEVVHEKTGLLVPPRDAEALAGALDRLVGDMVLRRAMGEAGHRRLVERFDEALVIQRQIDVYRRLFELNNLNWPE